MIGYEYRVLYFIAAHEKAEFDEILNGIGINEDSLRWAIEDLKLRKAITGDDEVKVTYTLTDEGRSYLSEFPEETLAKYINSKGSLEIKNVPGDMRIGFIWAKKNGWIDINDGVLTLTDAGKNSLGNEFNYPLKEALNFINDGKFSSIDDERAKILISRKLIEKKEKAYIGNIKITDEGNKLLSTEKEEDRIGSLSRNLMVHRGWEGKGFEPYSVDAEVAPSYPALRHPMNEFINYIRYKMVSLGFKETSGSIIQPAFWVFDSLFSPQDHPTRDMQDTFFLSSPEKIDIDDEELINKVKNMHLSNWKGKWDINNAKQAVLRTHTTAVSAHSMYNYRNVDFTTPVKLFTIDKAFRNESVDYKHLAEMYQFDGVVIGKDLSMANLIWILKEFFQSLGLEIRVQPSYFPFTEPSFEVHHFDNEHNDWIEMGGAGVIRNDITEALGLKGATVLAWGLGLDRMMLSRAKLNSLSDIYKNNIGWLRTRKKIEF
ncbi:phenylalanyl-tRNA synthetase subunit alpha [Candidatus Mancarchaeum acidiphilum]|uniref:phenylalanine--tRNA ligase n=1 Tax=Candidatus Mancarchaeum acidiphilum TaxID=1920749 RepID=A0A218NLZ5_9ARCH|nr:phenylalanine--tRNA ligase subunit alpha [Candidatus Mancarchaeum acidiphilum]ASI13493.1 phenylalanyl-tRNA synthetase subunit alpha [Candidatus Mancarchaeum acidiphilum]